MDTVTPIPQVLGKKVTPAELQVLYALSLHPDFVDTGVVKSAMKCTHGSAYSRLYCLRKKNLVVQRHSQETTRNQPHLWKLKQVVREELQRMRVETNRAAA